MNISEVGTLIDDLAEKAFTGQLELNFHRGAVGKAYTKSKIPQEGEQDANINTRQPRRR